MNLDKQVYLHLRTASLKALHRLRTLSVIILLAMMAARPCSYAAPQLSKSPAESGAASQVSAKAPERTIPRHNFKPALPGYQFKFPEDHYSHDEYRTEWWYYTGHLYTASGREFGFELTFFRSGVDIADGVKDSPWTLNNIYMAHFALSDPAKHRFIHRQKFCRPGVSRAGASNSEYKVWTENWSASRENATGHHHLLAQDSDMAIDLDLAEAKPPAVHGVNGVSQKASCVGCASHYYSLTRLPLKGTLALDGSKYAVSGIAWMDHEFGSNQLGAEQVGWDWYSIQLDDKTELMLYVMRLRQKGGKPDAAAIDPNSSGTIVYPDGQLRHLPLKDYTVSATSAWKSPHTGGKYPANWKLSIPSCNTTLTIQTLDSDQELVNTGGGISYWEGACTVAGTKAGKPIKGKAYVELTGYAKELSKNI